MKIKLLSGALVLVLALTLGTGGIAMAQPPTMPHAFYGDVTIGGNPASDGTTVSAHIGDLSWSTTTSVDQYGYSPIFQIPADDPATPEKDGGVNGEEITFKVEGTVATTDPAGPILFESGGIDQLDLAIAGEVPVTYTLTVDVSPSGSGTVSLSPTAVGNEYEADTTVELTASPASGYEFDSWSGDLTGSTNPDTIVMDSDNSVTANFTEEGAAPPPTPGVGGTAYPPDKLSLLAPWIALGGAVAGVAWFLMRRRRAYR